MNGTGIKQQQLTTARTTYSPYQVSKFCVKISENAISDFFYFDWRYLDVFNIVISETTMYKKG